MGPIDWPWQLTLDRYFLQSVVVQPDKKVSLQEPLTAILMGSVPSLGWRQLDVAIVGGGIGGMSAAIALRRQGHRVSIYERADFAGEAGASLSCAANGTRWLHEWGVDLDKGDGVVLRRLISRDWSTGKILTEYELNDYEERWGYVYYMFQRQSMHNMLKDTALGEEGEGDPATLYVNHKVRGVCEL